MIEQPFVSLGSHLNIALSSLDKYIDKVKENQAEELINLGFPHENHNFTIESLQKEQSELCEELNIERRRTENLNATFTRAITLSRHDFEKKLNMIKDCLINAQKQTPAVQSALSYLNEVQTEGENSKGTNVSELAQHAKEVEINVTRQKRENQALKRELEQISSEIESIQQQIDEATKNGQEIAAQRKENKEKLRKFVEEVKIQETKWRDRINTLQEQLTVGED